MKVFHNLIAFILTHISKRGKEYRFRKWIQLESIKEKIITAVENERDDFPDNILEYISTAVGVNSKWYEQAGWMTIISLFYACLSKSPVVHLPLLTPHEEKAEPEPWNYEGRTWHAYSHILAKSYGWTLQEISQLKVGEALAKIQEILTDEQLEREFVYGLSEIAYPYNPSTKTSVFKPMPRPHWMRPTAKPIPRFPIPKDVMPVGNVVTAGVLSEEYLPKEYVH